jgi:hypothetical protein
MSLSDSNPVSGLLLGLLLVPSPSGTRYMKLSSAIDFLPEESALSNTMMISPSEEIMIGTPPHW